MKPFERTLLRIVAVFSCVCTSLVAVALGRECISMGLWIGIAEGIIASTCALGALRILMMPTRKQLVRRLARRLEPHFQRAHDAWLDARWRERVTHRPENWKN